MTTMRRRGLLGLLLGAPVAAKALAATPSLARFEDYAEDDDQDHREDDTYEEWDFAENDDDDDASSEDDDDDDS